jgi:hypothetical protein
MRRRWGLAVMAWVLVAFLTTLVGLAAINSLGDGILGSAERPLTSESVAAELSATPSPEPSLSPSASALPSLSPPAETAAPPSGPPRTFSSAGGTVTASCAGDLVTLEYWSPASGYQADHVVTGPAQTVSIRFRQGGRGHGIRLAFSCANGSPIQSANTSNDD